MSLWYIWLIIAAILIILELLTGYIASFCLAVGCLAAMVADLCGGSVKVQMWTAAAGIVLAFVFFAPMLRKWHQKRAALLPGAVSNMDALIGRRAVVAVEVPAGGVGRVTIDGDNWQIKSILPQALAAGTEVEVVGYDSIILTVTPVVRVGK